MEHVDNYEKTLELVNHKCFEFIDSQFRNLYCHEINITSFQPDSVYINNRFGYKNEGGSVTVDLKLEHTYDSGQIDGVSNIQAPILFKNKGYVVGGYVPIHNILVFTDITHKFNKFTIEVIEKVSEYLKSTYTVDLDLLSFQFSEKKTARVTIGDKIFDLKLVGTSNNSYQQYVDKVTQKARETVLKIKSQYLESLKVEKARMERLRKSIRPMPEILYGNMIQYKVMISKESNYLVYSFPCVITVTHGVDEAARKSVKLDTPIDYKGILHLYVDEKDVLSKVRFTDTDGNRTHHLHTIEGDVCTGTTDILGRKTPKFEDILNAKVTISEALTRVNIHSCYMDSDMDLYNSIVAKLRKASENGMGAWSVRTPVPAPTL